MFFIAVGMSVDIKMMLDNPLILMQHLFVIMGIKIIVLFLLILYMGYNKSTAVSVSFLLSQSGEFGFVLFGAAKALGVISDELFISAVTIISFSMLFTPMIVNLGEKLSLRLDREPIKIKSVYVPEDSWSGVIIAGYGRVGRLVASMLEQAGKSYIAFDVDSKRVALGQREGRAVYYGELSDLEFLTQIGLDKVDAVIVTVDSHHASSKIISHIRSLQPTLNIFSRTRDMKTRELLLKHGVTWAMPESTEGSLRLAAEALLHLQMSEDEVSEILTSFRKDDYATIRDLYKKTS
jgi:glutathione-regulated potassium-efflux system protein KefB